MIPWKDARSIVTQTIGEWLHDEVPSRGAALSYYVLLSLGPLLVLFVGTMELFVSESNIREQIVLNARDYLGNRAAETVSTVLGRVTPPDLLSPESIVALGALLLGSTAVFMNLRSSLNAMWGVQPKPAGSTKEKVIRAVRERGRAFLMVAATGLLVGASFVLSSVAGIMESRLSAASLIGPLVLTGVDSVVSVFLMGLMFAAVFRTLPDVRIEWKAVWVGGFVTALLFTIGKVLVARLLANASWTSYYGPAASLVAFIVWIYFSAQIFYLGAEFTQVWCARRHADGADRVSPCGESTSANDDAGRSRNTSEPGPRSA